MLAQAVELYLTVRRACGFKLKSQGNLLRSFAAFSDAREKGVNGLFEVSHFRS